MTDSVERSIDKFRTNKGRIISRSEALCLGEADSAEYIPESEVDTLESVVGRHEAKGLDVLTYEVSGGPIILQTLRVPKNVGRGQGLGTAFMEDLCAYADRVGKDVELNVAAKEPGETTSSGRLREFYGRFGFVWNHGRHADYSRSCSMYRRPSKPAGNRPPRRE